MQVLRANSAADALLGESLEGKNLADWLPEAIWPTRPLNLIPPAIQVSHDGRLLELRPIHNVAENTQYWVLIIEDLTEVLMLREALRENSRQVEEFIQTMPLPAWIMDEAGRFVLQNEHCDVLPLCGQTCNYAACASAQSENNCSMTQVNADGANAWYQLHQQVLETKQPDALRLDLGRCGLWRIMLFPVRGDGAVMVGGVAIDLAAAERERLRTEGYITQLRQFAREFQFIREEERAEVARNIHDHLGQEITVLRLALHRLRQEMGATDSRVPHAWAVQLEGLAKQVDEVMKSAKRIAYELRPDVLRTQGLAAAASNLVIEFCKRIGIRGNLEVSEHWMDPDAGMALHLYRSLQEMLNNMAKHAKASSFFVRMQFDHHIYRLEVMDNGVGFPAKIVEQLSSGQLQGNLGLRGFFERAAIYGGEVKIVTRPEIKGSSVCLVLPAGLGLIQQPEPDAEGGPACIE